MGSGDLNMKKSWHPLLHTNQEKVWKKEKEALEERKRVDELRREREQEREMQELQRLQEEAGGKKRVEKLDWMYATPAAGMGPSANELEDYLLGKKRVDKLLRSDEALKVSKDSQESFIAIQNANTVRDTASKIRDDPLLSIKQQEQAAYQALLKDPTRLRQLKAAAGKSKDELREEKRKRKEERQRIREEREHGKSRRDLRDRSYSRTDRYDARSRSPPPRSSSLHREYARHAERDRSLYQDRVDSRGSDAQDDGYRRSRDERSTHSAVHKDGGASPLRRRRDSASPRRRDRSRSPRPRDYETRALPKRYEQGRSFARSSRSPPPHMRNGYTDERERQTAFDTSHRQDFKCEGDERPPPPRRASPTAPHRRHLKQENDVPAAPGPPPGPPPRRPSPPRRPEREMQAGVKSEPAESVLQIKSEPVDSAVAEADAREAKLAAMQAAASTMSSERAAYVARIKKEEEDLQKVEDDLRAKAHDRRGRSGGDGKGTFLIEQQRKAFGDGVDLADRVRRGKSGMQRIGTD